MSYESAVVGGLFCLRWGRKPEPMDVDRYAAEIARASQQQGRPLVGLFIVPADSSIPDEDFRRAQAAKLPRIMQHLRFAVAVFEGEGFFSSLKRSALVAILLLAPKRYQVYVRSTIRDALVNEPPVPLQFDGETALIELQNCGFIARGEPRRSRSAPGAAW